MSDQPITPERATAPDSTLGAGYATPADAIENGAILKQMLAAALGFNERAAGEPPAVRSKLAAALGATIMKLGYGERIDGAGFNVGGLVGPEAVQIMEIIMGPSGRAESWRKPLRMTVSAGVGEVLVALVPTGIVHEGWQGADVEIEDAKTA